MASEKTLWVWEHLPKNLAEVPDNSWLKEGDAVENLHRLEMSKYLFLVAKGKLLCTRKKAEIGQEPS